MKRERLFRLGYFVSVCYVKLFFAGTLGAALSN